MSESSALSHGHLDPYTRDVKSNNSFAIVGLTTKQFICHNLHQKEAKSQPYLLVDLRQHHT